MEISRKSVKGIFESEGVESFYHANSVLTACSFLKEGSLLSRGSLERKKLFQTKQDSDSIDKKLGLWFDVFVDSVDIHARAKRANVYGPVLFELDTSTILNDQVGKLWISKLNPLYWEGKKRKDRWFQSPQDLKENFSKGTFGHMIIFRHSGGEIPLKKHLKRVILDDPGLTYTDGEIDFFSQAYGALKASMAFSGIDVPIERRACPSGCGCHKSYQPNSSFAHQMFGLDV